MSLERLTYDKTALPVSMLPLVKSHIRVDFDDDDIYIQSATARAIGLIEAITSFAIAPATWTWKPGAGGPGSGACCGHGGEGSNRCRACGLDGYGSLSGFQLPLGPIATFTASVTDTADPPVTTDVTDDLEIVGNVDPSQFSRQWLVIDQGATLPAGSLEILLKAGFASAADLPPQVEDIILRMTAWLYENREMATMGGVDIQSYAASIMTGLWRPVV